jgi:hypothetical protein
VRRSGLGAALCRAWVRWYTWRLPTEIAQHRRDELESDLADHAEDSMAAGRGRLAHDLEVIRRTVGGTAADVSWRRGVLRQERRLQPASIWNPRRFGARANRVLVSFGACAVGAGIGAAVFSVAAATAGNLHDVLDSAIGATLTIPLVIGLLLRTSHPAVSTALIVAGAAASPFNWSGPAGYIDAVIVAGAAIASSGYRASDPRLAWPSTDGTTRVAVGRTSASQPRPGRGFVEVYRTSPATPYRLVAPVTAMCRVSGGLSRPPEISDVNDRLAAAAHRLGANAVIDVRYQRGPSLLGSEELQAFGIAAVVSADAELAVKTSPSSSARARPAPAAGTATVHRRAPRRPV